MEKSSSSHDYGCSTSQKKSCLLENLQGEDNYNRLHLKIEHNIRLNQYTNKFVCVIC